jgi:two-component system NtrC family sensor kinase
MASPSLALDTDAAAALQACRRELAEALEQQAATSEILAAISRMPADPQPVFEAIVAAGVRLFGDAAVAISLPDGDVVRALAIAEADPERAERWARVFPFPLTRQYIHGAAILDCRAVDVPDLLEPGGPFDVGKRNVAPSGYRAMAVVPLVREGRAIGAIAVVRVRPGRLTERQLALMQTFADQALIAIENTRLSNEREARNRELADALERQMATSQILRVISSSPTDVRPVFQTIADAALRLCDASVTNVLTFDGTLLHVGALAGLSGAGLAAVHAIFPRPPARDTAAGMAVLTRDVFTIEDVLADPDYACMAGPDWSVRSVLGVPLLRRGEPIGALAICRPVPGPFPAKMVALLSTFADQAVIAIENVRLFTEREARNRDLAEALEQQTATSDILRVISRSPTDVQPVFDTIAQAALRLCRARTANLVRFDGRELHVVALASTEPGASAVVHSIFPRPLGRDTIVGRAILTREVVTIEDVLSDAAYGVGHAAVASGFRSGLGVPLLRDGQPIGAIAIGRIEPGPLPSSQVALMQIFAEQAVIAIENTRLFNALQDKTRELEIASRHKSAFLANMSHELRTPLHAVLGFTRIVLRETRAQIAPKQAENLEKILASARHLVGLINATLDLTRIEAGRIEITPSELVLAPLLEECLRSVEPLCADGVRLEAPLATDLPPLRVDVEKLHQIVLNLLGNAVKFTERGRIELRSTASDKRVAIVVEDSGIGIPADKLEAVFEEFEQVDATHTRAQGGTGLGLAIARRLARAMGGDLTAVSTLGHGSTFTLTLPLRWSDADEA